MSQQGPPLHERAFEHLSLRRGAALGVGLVALTLGLLWTHHLVAVGLMITGDSAVFFQAASQLFWSGEWTAPPTRPPLYPALLALGMGLEPFVADTAAWASGGLLTAGLLITASTAWRFTQDAVLSIIITVLAATWPAITQVYTAAWTEGLAATLLVVHIGALAHWHHSRSRSALVLAALTVGLDATTRFIGLAAVAVFVGWLAWDALKRHHVRSLVLGAALSVITPAAWLSWSAVARGSATGDRKPATESWAHHLADLADALSGAFEPAPLLLVAIVLAAVGAGGACHSRGSAQGDGRRRSNTESARYVGVQVVVQLVAVVAACSRVRVDPIGYRYLAPTLALVPVGLALAWGAASPGLGRHRTWVRKLVVALLCVVIAGLAGPLGRQLDFSLQRDGDPGGITGGGFDLTATHAQLGQHLARAFQDADAVDIVVATPERSALQWTTLLHRRSLLGDAGLEPTFTAHPVSWRADLELRGDDGRTRVLRTRSALAVGDRAGWIRRLHRALRDSGGPTLVLTHTRIYKDLDLSDDLAGVLPDGWSISHTAEAAPYRLLTVAPDATGPTAEAPDRRSLAEGWRPLASHMKPRLTVDDGALRVTGLADVVTSACGPVTPIHGAARVTGHLRTHGLGDGGFAAVTLDFRGADGSVLPDPENGQHLRLVDRATREDTSRALKGAETDLRAVAARACVRVQGAGVTAWFSQVEVGRPERVAQVP